MTLLSNRRTVLLIWAIAGILYVCLASLWYASNIAVLIPLMKTAFGTLVFRMLWFGIELWPVTIVVTLLRINPVRSVVVIVVYEIVAMAAAWAFFGWNGGEAFGLFWSLMPNLFVQLPVWLLTFLVYKMAAPRRPTASPSDVGQRG